ncbi:DUF192 domain-containing protein [Pseudoalteromonas sp. NEC-BIFX-2020_002]|uniref:DUF192 domain-containing protein n=1 Tax=Pseudoalteromonas neustonica TaxID=1840331 RepID=A0ABU9U4Q9_9GAMM|nr:DUF192 domain-containing protein [Pseudoalteromonas sp. NEC-BIFX-2020_002]NNG43693.1 DUF192 domain-containing protein [Pseudoalteromonas sp. NEC-BIFX-2020_002]
MTCSLYKNKVTAGAGVLIGNVLIANTWWLRLRGLLGRTLNENDGLLIVPCNSVHMIGMRYAIDVVYLNKQNTIIKIVKNLRPWQVSTCRNACKVIELSTKNTNTKILKVGDNLTIE